MGHTIKAFPGANPNKPKAAEGDVELLRATIFWLLKHELNWRNKRKLLEMRDRLELNHVDPLTPGNVAEWNRQIERIKAGMVLDPKIPFEPLNHATRMEFQKMGLEWANAPLRDAKDMRELEEQYERVEMVAKLALQQLVDLGLVFAEEEKKRRERKVAEVGIQMSIKKMSKYDRVSNLAARLLKEL
jgi:hypothetical protein